MIIAEGGTRLLKDFFAKKIGNEMLKMEFHNPVIFNFLVQLLTIYCHNTPSHNVFCARKEEAIGVDLLKMSAGDIFFTNISDELCKEIIKIKAERLLISLGIFPESLLAGGKRAVSYSYYLQIEKALVNILSELVLEPEWAEVDKNFMPVITTMYRARLQMNFKIPEMSIQQELIRASRKPLI
ncbi:hypothetical protein COS18_01200 [Candidatus Falkowbacteria bacterium CG02_land_8_20_14_3_00_36_14]|uniref:Uncharacterized protein n=1 Tax=Candidatus Falkowbacteria bacterium CG02_land_8_20_14_3_00_36_14 TaxID=1974560 RepID=A0A2M7DQA2_9BACT|nr:MAG: hypothetical protein COS18_01200 [Candidatus Falkowbacteria bacterium CG02_land_8_20_14_3_00_36_14]